MKYWLEKTYPSKRVAEDFTTLLLSPMSNSSGADIYINMRLVLPNDIVFHLNQDTNMLVGYSRATDSYDELIINGESYYTINLEEFKPFKEEIDIDTFLLEQAHQEILTQVKVHDQKEVFYQFRDEKYSVKQGGYLTQLDERIVKLFENYSHEKFKPIVASNESASYPEGANKYVTHKHKERSKKLIKLAKANFKSHNKGELFCEICKFNFVEKYGKIGEDFIEAHHSLPVSQLSENHRSTIEDIVLLCSNCHSIVHRKKEWLSIEELKSLL